MSTLALVELADSALRERLEPLLDMYPVAISELRATGDPTLETLEEELAELERYVAALVAQLPALLPLH